MENGPELVICNAMEAIINPNGKLRPRAVSVTFTPEIIEHIMKDEANKRKFLKWISHMLYNSMEK